MLSITYTSAASASVGEDGLAAILIKARANNRRDGITGALLYRGDRFVQILEGTDTVVRQRFEIIAADPRHRSINVIRELQIPERQFPQWTMGFRQSDSDAGRQLPGYEDIMGRRGAARIAHAENEAQQYLLWLGEYWLPQTS